MPRGIHQKEKLLVLLEVLNRESDEEHPVPLSELLAALSREEISAERKSVYDDMEILRRRGWDVELERRKGYYLASRPFELAELKLLVDAVQSSRFISEGKSRSLIKKLEQLCSRWQAAALQRQVYVSGRDKTMNEAVLYTIDAIHTAIGGGRMLSFRYFDYDVQKAKVFRKEGAAYEVSPVGLLRSDERYYLVALQNGEKRHYRVDRMADARPLEQERDAACAGVDMSAYTSRHFGMFSGQERQVRLKCENRMAHVMLDRFGMDVMLVPDGAEHFTLTVPVAVSQQFYGWLFGLGADVELLGPPDVREEYRRHLAAALERHTE